VLPNLMVAEASQFPELAEFWRHEVIGQGVGLFRTLIARGQARGEFRPMDPEHGARLCIAPLMIIMLWRTTFARFDAVPYDYQGLVDAHLETLLRGLKADGTTP
jgi:hypothetical protein